MTELSFEILLQAPVHLGTKLLTPEPLPPDSTRKFLRGHLPEYVSLLWVVAIQQENIVAPNPEGKI